MIKLTKQTFSGTGHVFDGTLSSILRSLAQNQAVSATARVTALVDNGGGVSAGQINPQTALVNHQLTGSDSAQKAAIEAAFVTVAAGVSEVVYQLNALAAVVPAFPTLTNNIGGVAPSGTVGAITQTVAGVNVSLASAVGVMAVHLALKQAIVQAAQFVNALATATGVAQIANNSGLPYSYSTTFAAISTSTGNAVSGADATNANAGILATQADTMLAELANDVKALTATLALMHTSLPTITVVAQ